MKNVLAIIGAVTLCLWLLAALGVGHFVYIYGPDKLICTKE